MLMILVCATRVEPLRARAVAAQLEEEARGSAAPDHPPAARSMYTQSKVGVSHGMATEWLPEQMRKILKSAVQKE